MSGANASPILIEGAGALCAVGRGVPQVHASVQAGIGRAAQSSVHDRFFEPMRLALFPEAEVEALVPALEARGLTARQRRIVRLAAAPLREALAALPVGARPPPLFVGLPEARSGERTTAAQMVDLLGQQAAVALDVPQSRALPQGRASGLLAVEAALAFLSKGTGEFAVAGGVDTYLDLGLLAELDAEGRILGERVMDGFVPGEGAAFLLLTNRRAKRGAGAPPRVQILGGATAQDPGHRYSDKPAKGEGLAHALEKLLAGLARAPAPIAHVYAGFNGESFGAKEWGVARLRHGDRFAQVAQVMHPADCYGDVGAASGPMLGALAFAALSRGAKTGPVLVFASSDRAERSCALIDLLT